LSKKAPNLTLKDHLDRWGMKACPIDTGLKLLGQRYALHIMRNMILLKQKGYSFKMAKAPKGERTGESILILLLLF
jgi:hypothetical protein